jgi:hypothetical protein
MKDRSSRILRFAWALTRLVLSALTVLVVSLTVFFVAFFAAAVVTPSSSYDTIIALAIACGLAAGAVATFGVWRLLRLRTTCV